MEVDILQSLTEYIAMMSCLYRLAHHRPILKIQSIIAFLRVKSYKKKITLPYGFMVSLSYHT